jgi:DNA-directed RNA polymerase subunit M/transcription elongation factor TFIIS
MEMKFCNGCQSTLPVAEFYIDRSRMVPKTRCRTCSKSATKAWRKLQPDYETRRYQKVKGETRERHLIRKYGVTSADYESMLVGQGGQCAICGAIAEDQPHKVFHVDHCHETGRVRGLLCRGCNHVLGHMKDDPEKLRKAIDYLAVPQIAQILGQAIAEVFEGRVT